MDQQSRINFLFEISRISNSVLARRTHIDPSYISKIRHGARNLPKDSPMAAELCSVVTQRCVNEYERKYLCEMIGVPEGTSDRGLESRMLEWIYQDDVPDLPQPKTEDMHGVQCVPQKRTEGKENQKVQIFYGMDGRRQALTEMMNLAFRGNGSVKLQMYSDEEEREFHGDLDWFHEWAGLFRQLIHQGGTIEVIHRVDRSSRERLETVRQWLPLYGSGQVNPYYYPGHRDGIFRRSLIVLPGVAAAFSASVGQDAEQAVSFLVRDRQCTDSFSQEFASYKALCVPLLESHEITPDRFLVQLESYLEGNSDHILMSNGLPLVTISSKVIRNLEQRISAASAEFLHIIHERWNDTLLQNPGGHRITHVMRLAPPAEVRAGKVRVVNLGILEFEQVFFSPQEYCDQLEHILWMVDTFQWYHVVLNQSGSKEDNLYVVSEKEACFFSDEQPDRVFRVREHNMVSAFLEYAHQVERESEMDRQEVKKKIREQIALCAEIIDPMNGETEDQEKIREETCAPVMKERS